MGVLSQQFRKRRPVKSATESRKVRKPLMEKKRRDRINCCLTTLADLLVGAKMAPEVGNKQNRLEKADILELTVKYWDEQKANTGNSGSPASEEISTNGNVQQDEQKSYVGGYSYCVDIVEDLLEEMVNEDRETDPEAIEELKTNLLTHLSGQLHELEAIKEADVPEVKSMDVSESNLTLIPTKLDDGSFALVLKTAAGDLTKGQSIPSENCTDSMWRPW